MRAPRSDGSRSFLFLPVPKVVGKVVLSATGEQLVVSSLSRMFVYRKMKTGALKKTSEREKGRDLCLYLRGAVECGKPPMFPRFRS